MHKRFLFGFTVVELMVVIVGISILAAIALVGYDGVQERANNTAVKTDTVKVADALNIYYSQKGRYPITSAELGTIDTVSVSRNRYVENRAFIYCYEAGASAGANMALLTASKGGERYVIENEGTITVNPTVYASCANFKPSYQEIKIHDNGTVWMTNF